jgi:hypothetical protein
MCDMDILSHIQAGWAPVDVPRIFWLTQETRSLFVLFFLGHRPRSVKPPRLQHVPDTIFYSTSS